MTIDSRKVSIIGLGKVGVTAAYACVLRHVADELVLISRSQDKGEGEQLDLEHGLPFLEPVKIKSSSNFSDLSNSDVIVITAGAAQKVGQSRLDLASENITIVDQLATEISPYVGDAVVIMVSNPVDVLTYHLAKKLHLPEGRVIGTGTMLDTARFRFHLGEMLNVHPRSVHAYILGEHGESAFPVLESGTVGGQPLKEFPHYSKDQALVAFAKTKEAAAKIIKAKGATYYAIGVVISQLVRTILKNKRSVVPVSVPITNYYGQSDLAISVPCIVGRNGAEQILSIQLSDEEKASFQKSCEIIRSNLPQF